MILQVVFVVCLIGFALYSALRFLAWAYLAGACLFIGWRLRCRRAGE